MKKKIFLLIVFLVSFTLCGCKQEDVGFIGNVKTSISNENEHTKKDIERTFDIIKREFETNGFRDCELLTIEYTGEFVDLERELLVSEEKADEAIVLSFTFKTGNNPEQVFNANSTYEYTADFIKGEMGWKKLIGAKDNNDKQ